MVILSKEILHECTKCKEYKPSPNSYFTEFRGWFCDDCKYDCAANLGKPEVIVVLERILNE